MEVENLAVVKPVEAQALPRSRPLNGRVWKTIEKQRHSATKRIKSLKSSFAERQERKNQLLAARTEYQAMLEKVKEEKREMRRRREQKKKMKEENEKKAEIVQVIRDTKKIKKMTKKQLKMIRKA